MWSTYLTAKNKNVSLSPRITNIQQIQNNILHSYTYWWFDSQLHKFMVPSMQLPVHQNSSCNICHIWHLIDMKSLCWTSRTSNLQVGLAFCLIRAKKIPHATLSFFLICFLMFCCIYVIPATFSYGPFVLGCLAASLSKRIKAYH